MNIFIEHQWFVIVNHLFHNKTNARLLCKIGLFGLQQSPMEDCPIDYHWQWHCCYAVGYPALQSFCSLSVIFVTHFKAFTEDRNRD
jgi:hypothetical protein